MDSSDQPSWQFQALPKLPTLKEFLVGWKGTLLSTITADLLPLIYTYYKFLFSEKPKLIPNYDYHYISRFGRGGTNRGQFKYPRAVAIDHCGNIFIGDGDNSRVQVFSSDGIWIKTIGGGQHSKRANKDEVVILCPMDLTFDLEGNLVVADSDSHMIQVLHAVDHKAKFLIGSKKGDTDGNFSYPYGVLVDTHGRFIVADSDNHRLQIFNPHGKWSKTITGEGDLRLKFPVGLVVDNEEIIWVSESNNHRIQGFNYQGNSVRSFGSKGSEVGQLWTPWGLAIDQDGMLVVADRDNHRIQIFTREGKSVKTFGKQGKREGQFDLPYSVAIDKNGGLLCVDRNNNCVQRWGLPHALLEEDIYLL